MKKQTLLLTTVLLSSATLFAQEQLPNNSFETWTEATNPDSSWFTLSELIVSEGLSNPAIESKNTNTAYVAAGSSSVLLETKTVTIGTSHPNLAGLIAYTDSFTNRPDSVSFWLSSEIQGTDSAYFAVSLYKDNGTDVGGFPAPTGNVSDYSQIVPTVAFYITQNYSFQKFTFPINYSSTDAPDSIIVQFGGATHKDPNLELPVGTVGTKVYIDDVQFIYNNDSASGISTIAQNKVSVYPNPFTDKLTVEPNISYRLFDLVGREVDKNNLSALPVGTYILTTDKGSTRVVKTEK